MARYVYTATSSCYFLVLTQKAQERSEIVQLSSDKYKTLGIEY